MNPIFDETKTDSLFYRGIDEAEPRGDRFYLAVEGHSGWLYTRYECEVLIKRMTQFVKEFDNE